MCGIIGYSSSDFKLSDIEHGLKTMKHRGPDEEVIIKVNKSTNLAMNRLAIRDLQKKLYPFKYKNLSLLFNGEIYNIKQVKKMIPNYRFKSNCDAEVLLPLFYKKKEKAFNRLIGMFSLAIYDNFEECIYLARDKFGEKPLYYYFNGESFFFGSELRSFPQSIKSISLNAIPTYLAFGYIPQSETFFKNIYKVLPGEYIKYDIKKRKLVKKRYSIHRHKIDNLKTINIIKQSEKLDKLLNRIISEKIIADVPVGVFLSGGVDSSLIAVLAKKYLKNTLFTFSVGFKELEVDESFYSKKVAKHLKSQHKHIEVTPNKVIANWEKIILSLDEPISDPAIIPTYFLANTAKKYVKVILSGEGADEMFAGYSRYKEEIELLKYKFLHSKYNTFLLNFINNESRWQKLSSHHFHYSSVKFQSLWKDGSYNRKKYIQLINQLWKNFLLKKFNITIQESFGIPATLQLYDLEHYVAEELCMKIDKTVMQHSIEARAPYLDSRLIPFLSVSSILLKQGYREKYLLRKVATHYLPYSIAFREKKGFEIPVKKWLKKEMNHLVKELEIPHSIITEIISKKTINKLISQLYQNSDGAEFSLWNLAILNSWLKHNVQD